MSKVRIGFGYDVHRLAEGEELWIGGIMIQHYKGSVAHSDGDVLIHAICDGLLGAVNKRDIGFHFPDTDKSYKGIDSKILLKKVIEILKDLGYTVGNIDTTICMQTPKLNPHIEKMQEVLSSVMQIPADNISIKATTTEKLGFVGTENGISAYAVVLVEKI